MGFSHTKNCPGSHKKSRKATRSVLKSAPLVLRVFYTKNTGDDCYVSSLDVSQCDLSNLKLALFVGCNTGYVSYNFEDLPEATVNAGAETAIGFTKTIKCHYANLWTEYFWERICLGYTVSQSCYGALSDVNIDFNRDYTMKELSDEEYNEGHGLDSYVIYGNANLIFEW